MERSASRSVEMMIFTMSILLPGALLAYAWFVLAPPSDADGGFKPSVAVTIPDTTGADAAYVGVKTALWGENEEEPWLVVKPKEALPPVNLPPPLPSVPKPATPLPAPGPRLEHTGGLPRWGQFPAKIEVPANVQK